MPDRKCVSMGLAKLLVSSGSTLKTRLLQHSQQFLSNIDQAREGLPERGERRHSVYPCNMSIFREEGAVAQPSRANLDVSETPSISIYQYNQGVLQNSICEHSKFYTEL